MKGQGLNDLPRCELERRSSHHKGILFEVPKRTSRASDANAIPILGGIIKFGRLAETGRDAPARVNFIMGRIFRFPPH
jgi:hypothetical protein